MKEDTTTVTLTNTSSSHTKTSSPESSDEFHDRYFLLFKRLSFNNGGGHESMTQATKVTIMKGILPRQP